MSATKFIEIFARMNAKKQYRIWLYLFGFLTMPFVIIHYMVHKANGKYSAIRKKTEENVRKRGSYEELYIEALLQVQKKNKYFSKMTSVAEMEGQAKTIATKNLSILLEEKTREEAQKCSIQEVTISFAYETLMEHKLFFIYSLVFSFPMYFLMFLYSWPILKYITDRMFMMIFVLFGVVFLVFTILHFSPMDPAVNILGVGATQEQVDNFSKIYGLDRSYLEQLFLSFKNLITFDLGVSYQGTEDVAKAIMSRMPTTLSVAFWAVVVSVSIAIPAGIISAIKQYSSFDYIFMFIALLGLSIPNFWLGLILILNFSINLQWLPATFQVDYWASMIMPAIVLGTGMSAEVARMTRSSMLEVKKSDYILTARAKGLTERKIVLKHILGNAMIPIITVVGMQFGAMLGGASVTEKVFNINGIGSFIVDKQFIPDIPIVLAGVVYLAVVVGIANLVVDILYALIDPRIKSKMKNY